MVSKANSLNKHNVNILKGRATKMAIQGVIIALVSILVATILVSYYEAGEISLAAMIEAQKTNYALWILDIVPFIFAFWGQYSSSIIAYEAGALIDRQTEDLQSLRIKTEILEQQANFAVTHDIVTRLPNRALFYDRVEQAIKNARFQNSEFTLLLIEIENFKEIYDTLGRMSSDMVIKQISIRLQSGVSGFDSVARLDSNVFALLLTGKHEISDTEKTVSKIHSELEPVFIVDRFKLTVQTSIGIVFYPRHGEDVDYLVQLAGVALYVANKSNNGYAVYDPSFDESSPHHLTLMSELRHAFRKNEMELYYQPKVSLQTGLLYGVEALVRWNHPKHGLVTPDNFILLAERTRMINPLTVWVLQNAFKQCSDWHSKGLNLKVSVNLSVKDLHDPELPELISGIAGSTGVNPEWVLLEITESSIMTDPERAMDIIMRIHEMGFQLSIDDYGTGYSSLAYLKKMPLTELKIDRSFVFDILSSENDAVIVKATINLAHNLGLQVTAEGVESEKVLTKLKDFGCDIAQGYHIARPLSVGAFDEWVEQSNWMPKPIKSAA